eukprot:6185527-Pleurochrysis_carterae.AAC.1
MGDGAAPLLLVLALLLHARGRLHQERRHVLADNHAVKAGHLPNREQVAEGKVRRLRSRGDSGKRWA